MAKRPKAPDEIVSPALASEVRPRVVTDDTMKLEQFTRETPVEATDGLLASLSDMVARAQRLEADLEEIEEMRKVRSARLRELTEDLIPAALDEAGVASFKTSTGMTVAIEEVVSATLGKGKDESPEVHSQRKERALEWLDENGHDGLVKVTYDVKLGRGETENDQAVRDALNELGVEFARDEGIHHQTLSAFVKERLASGDRVPLDLFRVAKHRRAKIKAPKGK